MLPIVCRLELKTSIIARISISESICGFIGGLQVYYWPIQYKPTIAKIILDMVSFKLGPGGIGIPSRKIISCAKRDDKFISKLRVI